MPDASVLDQFFRFKVGEIVIVKAATLPPISKNRLEWGKLDTQVLVVQQRHITQCSGGWQAEYWVSPQGREGGAYDKPVLLNEAVIAPLSEAYRPPQKERDS